MRQPESLAEIIFGDPGLAKKEVYQNTKKGQFFLSKCLTDISQAKKSITSFVQKLKSNYITAYSGGVLITVKEPGFLEMLRGEGFTVISH